MLGGEPWRYAPFNIMMVVALTFNPLIIYMRREIAFQSPLYTFFSVLMLGYSVLFYYIVINELVDYVLFGSGDLSDLDIVYIRDDYWSYGFFDSKKSE